MNPQRKRIAILTPGGIGDENSGMYIPVLRNLVEGIAGRLDVHIFSLAPREWLDKQGSAGNASINFFPASHEGSLVQKARQLANAVRNEHRRRPFDIIHGLWAIPCGVIAVLLGRTLGITSVVTFLGGETAFLPQIPYGNMTRWSTRVTTMSVSRETNELVLLTLHQASALHARGCTREVHIIPFGVNAKMFPFMKKDIGSRPLHVLHVANIHALKDQHTLLRTFKHLDATVDSRLRIVGEDQSNGAIPRLAKDLGIAEKVEFIGKIPHKELPRHYSWAHILLHTSMHEAQAVVVSEAAASGLLIAGTRTGLIADLGDAAAVIADVGDSRVLTAGILDCIRDPVKCAFKIGAAYQWACTHDAEWTIGQYVSLYEQAG